ncbi:hypothetical protein HZS_7386 [Henneguya salminicola]|nr:hypothetical protein HZS_7386 [Henneguya salminicola]
MSCRIYVEIFMRMSLFKKTIDDTFRLRTVLSLLPLAVHRGCPILFYDESFEVVLIGLEAS